MYSVASLFSVLILLFLINAVQFDAVDGRPEHIHLSLSSQKSEMNVMWYTENEEEKTIVQYGRHSNSYTNEMVGSSQPLKYGSGYMHHATMTDLVPATTYYYRVGNDEEWSPEFSFHTQRDSKGLSESDQKVKFLAFGDMGTFPRAYETVNAISQREVKTGSLDFVLHVGDMAYAFGNFTKWNTWFNWVQNIAAFTPYMICTGNRDEPEIIKERFYMPLDKTFSLYKPQEKQNFYYSYDYAFVHVVAISIRDNYTKSSDQYKWLENDLKKAHARVNDPNDDLQWIVMIGHTPLYSSSNGHTGGNKELRNSIEDLLLKYGVALGLWGDDHGYERTYPIFDAVPDDSQLQIHNKVQTFTSPNKTMHILTGTSGIDLDGWIDEVAPDWSAYREATHGYTKIEVTRNILKGKFVRVDGSIADEFAIVKPYAKITSGNGIMFLLWLAPLASVAFFTGWRRRLFTLHSINAATKIT